MLSHGYGDQVLRTQIHIVKHMNLKNQNNLQFEIRLTFVERVFNLTMQLKLLNNVKMSRDSSSTNISHGLLVWESCFLAWVYQFLRG
jgi:hypothetical protein